MYRAGLPMLGARLLAAAAFLQPGRPAADIGCDHGKLAVWLVMKGICPRVVAVDARPMPLARAQALARQTGTADRVDCRLGDGLAVVRPGEVEQVVVAGLSAETIIEILSPHAWVRQLRLVLAPASRPERLRRWLCENGYRLLQEEAVLEGGRARCVMLTAYTGQAAPAPALFYEVGLLHGRQGEAARRYITGRLSYLRQRRLAPLDEEARRALDELINEVEGCLE